MLLQKYSIGDLEKKFKSEMNPRVKLRLQIILFLKEGKSQREVSAVLRMSTGIVPYWKKRFEKEGTNGLEDKKGRGRISELNRRKMKELSFTIDKGIKMKDGYRRGFKTKDVKEFIQNILPDKRTVNKLKYDVLFSKSKYMIPSEFQSIISNITL